MENDTGFPLIPNVFSGFNSLVASAACGSLSVARVLTGQFNPANGIGLANTSLVFFGNRLFALAESDLPYAVNVTPDGDIDRLGRHDFDEKLTNLLVSFEISSISSSTLLRFPFDSSSQPPTQRRSSTTHGTGP